MKAIDSIDGHYEAPDRDERALRPRKVRVSGYPEKNNGLHKIRPSRGQYGRRPAGKGMHRWHADASVILRVETADPESRES